MSKDVSPTYQRFRRDLAIFVLLFIVVSMVLEGSSIGRDETDSPSQRSDVALRIDHATGCHYLEGQGGGLTPRLDRAGHQICR